MTVPMYPGAGTPETINLASLISLDDAGFEDGCLCYRGLDQDHVGHFMMADMASWPALDVVNVNVAGQMRHAVIDGYHRWEAARLLKAPTISVRAGSYASENEVIEAAFRANLKNGRQVTTGERSDYALWLYWQEPSDKPNLSAIARKVGLHPSVVNRLINKQLKEIDAREEAEARGSSLEEITETEKLLKAIRRYMEKEVAFLAGQHSERSAKKRAASLCGYVTRMKDQGKQRTAIQDLQTLAQTLTEITFDKTGQKKKNA